jgi:arylsulfatase A-like enzyme
MSGWPSRRRLLLGGTAALAVGAGALAWRARGRRPPNLVLVLTDDQGLNDLGCYWTPPPGLATARIDTPRLDQMASEGLRLTGFSVAASLCTPSRAALLTGSYPPRVGFGAKEQGSGVLSPDSREGLPAEAVTLAEVLKGAGYRTACIGKWHLGHHPPFRPTRQGFDEFYGIPWSNNQTPLVLIRGEERVRPLDPRTPLVAPFTREALSFVARHQDQPFFLYLAYSAPHEPLAVMPSFEGSSPRGRYGDAVAEIDHHIGLLLDGLAEQGLERDTLVIFTSDHGPNLKESEEGTGSAWPLRGGKGEVWEGGFRSPCLWRWPGVLPEGQQVPGLITALDLLPTLAGLAGAALPSAPIDGIDVWPVLSRQAPPPERTFFYYARGRLEAVRDARYKRVFDNPVRTPATTAALYDLEQDPAETTDIAAAHPEVLARLEAEADGMRQRLGDVIRGVEGTEARPPGIFEG